MKKIILLMSILFLTSFISAISYPEGFNGNIIINGGGNVEGKTLVGYLDGNIAGTTILHDNIFDIVITDEIGNGGEIEFYIGTKKADETFTFSTFEVVTTSLTFTIQFNEDIEEFCGDNICNNGETCSSCSNDCGACSQESSSSSSGGGSSGGGSSNPKTLISSPINNQDNGAENEVIDLSIDNLNKKEKSSSTSFLTGAVTGVTEFVKSPKKVAVSFIGMIGILTMFIVVKNQRLKKV